MKQLSNNFKKFDIFGQEIRLLVDGSPAFRTQIGACATLILFAILAYSCNTFIYDMNNGKNAILNSKEEVISENDGFTFNSSKLIFAVGLLDYMGQPIPNENRRIFEISFYFCSKSLNETNCDYIPSTICGNRIREISSQLYIPKAYENITYCMDEEYIQNNSTIRLQGSTRQDNFTLLGSLVQRCANSSEWAGCASTDEIDGYLKNANMYYSYSFHQFNKELPYSPYENSQNIDANPLYYKVRKYLKIYLQYSVSVLEYNPFYFFPSFEKYDGVEYLNTVVDSALNFEDDSSFAQVELNLEAKKTLMDVAAKIGGLFTIIKVLFEICFYPIQYILYRLYLINFVIKQKNSINQQSELLQPFQKELTIISIIKQSFSRQIYIEQSQVIENLLDIKEILINPLRLTRQVEDLYGSMRRFDFAGQKQANMNINQEIDELVANNEAVDFRCSSRTINQERKLGSQMHFRIPNIQLQVQ